MTDILVTSPFRPFTLPTQFKAVFNGHIYCGTVDAVDPSVSQVQVYLVNESGDKVPVAQPLRTNAGGFLVYNGQPAKFVTSSNHSLLVRDSLGSQLWYAPDVSKADPDAVATIIRSQSRESLRRSYAEAGYNLVAGSFEAGGTLVNVNDVLLQERTGKAFSGPAGTVAAGTNPSSGGFVDRSGSLKFKNISDLTAATWLQVGDVVSVTGYTSPTDGCGHSRVVSPSNDGSGVAIGPLWANVIPDPDGVDVKWLGPDVTPQQIRTMLQYSATFKPNIKLTSLSRVFSLWAARQEHPIAFFGDSTTDGATTTGHVPSTPTVDGVSITESPNAYCKILEDTIKRAIPNYPSGQRVIYNAGFDSQSMANDFAIDKFDSIFIDSDAPFVDAKMIGFAWGVTDVINNNNPVGALVTYSRNLEALVLYSLTKGRQPFLVSPVPMWVAGVNLRNGWQLLALIDEANSNIASRYNLDIISLREGIELDTEVNGNPLTHFSPDQVHPNDVGHSAIAGGLFAKLCPNVFTDRDSIVCGSPNIMMNSYSANPVQKATIPTKYDFFFSGGVYRFFAYLKEPKILTANSFNLGERHTITPTATAVINTYNDKSSVNRNIFASSLDFFSGTFGVLVDSKEFVSKLPVGLSEITMTIPSGRALGSLKFSDDDYISVENVSATNQKITQKYRNLETYSKGLPNHDSDFDLSQYYLCKGTSTFSIECVAFNALNAAVCFNVSSDKKRYNYLKLLADKVEWWVVVGGVHTKKAEALKDSAFNTSNMVNDAVRLKINIISVVDSTSSADTVTFTVNGMTAYSNLVSTSQTLLNIKQGWGIGLFDLDINGLRKSLSDITVVSNK